MKWVRNNFDQSVHDVEIAVASDNTNFFGDGKIKLKVKLKNFHSIEPNPPPHVVLYINRFNSIYLL